MSYQTRNYSPPVAAEGAGLYQGWSVSSAQPSTGTHTNHRETSRTHRLLKTLLPGRCIWTCLRTVEGYDYEGTLKELKKLYPPKEDDETAVADLPEAIRSLVEADVGPCRSEFFGWIREKERYS